MTDFDVISLGFRSPVTLCDIDLRQNGSGHIVLETEDPADAYMFLFSIEGATVE